MSAQGKPSKRPKLSLSIKPPSSSNIRSSRNLAAVDPKSPTAFNTLSNVYVTAIERSTPVTAINTHEQHSPPPPRAGDETKRCQRLQVPGAVSYPETPLTANALSPTQMDIALPSIMTATPPLSAGPVERNEAQKFTFSAADTQEFALSAVKTHLEARTPRRRASLSHSLSPWSKAPYSHPRSLRSILRNSPLPPRTARTPMSPRRQSLRLQEKAARRVAYNNPLEQTIITNKYTKSHIDLLIEDASPESPADGMGGDRNPDTVLDLALAFTGDETKDGGQTPGPFEEMRRRMAGLAAATPNSPSGYGGIRKKKRREKKRRWVWTIGKEEEEEEENDEDVGSAMAATRAVNARAASEPPQTTSPLHARMSTLEHA